MPASQNGVSEVVPTSSSPCRPGMDSALVRRRPVIKSRDDKVVLGGFVELFARGGRGNAPEGTGRIISTRSRGATKCAARCAASACTAATIPSGRTPTITRVTFASDASSTGVPAPGRAHDAIGRAHASGSPDADCAVAANADAIASARVRDTPRARRARGSFESTSTFVSSTNSDGTDTSINARPSVSSDVFFAASAVSKPPTTISSIVNRPTQSVIARSRAAVAAAGPPTAT